MSRDNVLFLAIIVAVFMPALPQLGNPENIAALLLLLVIVFRGGRRDFSGLYWGTALIVMLVGISTVVGSQIAGGYSVNPRPVGVYLRFIVCVQAVRCATDPPALFRKLLWLGLTTSAFAILQFLSSGVAELTATYYLDPSRSAVFIDDFSGDTLVRVIGVFENPSTVGLLSICLSLLSIHAAATGQLSKKLLPIFLVIHVVAGLLAFSKVFFAGLPFVIAQLILLRQRGSLLVFASIAAAALWFALTQSGPLIDVIQYAFNASLDPEVTFDGRYIDEQVSAVARSWLLGYGIVSLDNVLINDSMYLSTLAIFGTLGAAAISLPLVAWLWGRRRKLHVTFFFVLAIILVAAVGSNSILGFRVNLFLTALCALIATQRQMAVKRY